MTSSQLAMLCALYTKGITPKPNQEVRDKKYLQKHGYLNKDGNLTPHGKDFVRVGMAELNTNIL